MSQTPWEKMKVHRVMKEFKTGKLNSSSGQSVEDPKQAIAIALSEAGLARKKKKAPEPEPKEPKDSDGDE